MKVLCFWSVNSGCHGLSHEVPMTLLINNHDFCPHLPYLIGEVGLRRGGGVVSVIQFTPLSSTPTPA